MKGVLMNTFLKKYTTLLSSLLHIYCTIKADMKDLSFVICFFLLFTNTFPCIASNDTQKDSSSDALLSTAVWPDGPSIDSYSAILMEASTGTILYSKNMTESLYPASITKIMTALLCVENCSMNETVTFSHEAIFNVDMDSSRVGIDEGEELTVEQCLYGMLLESDNQIAYALAEHVGGSYDSFIAMMNQKAEELGCQNTHFNNPNGLPDKKHHTCAYDMALILNAAIKNDTFRSISSTRQYICSPTNKQPESRIWNNHHKMFPKKEYTYDGFEGGKTGYTTVALNTLASYAKRDNIELVCIVMKAPSNCHYLDTASLFNYGFQNFQVLNVSENETSLISSQSNIKEINTDIFNSSADINIDSDSNIVLPNSYSFDDVTYDILTDTTSDNTTIATLSYKFADHNIGTATVSITPSSSSDGYKFKYHSRSLDENHNSNETESSKSGLIIKYSKPLMFFFGGLAILSLLFFLLLFIIRYKRNTMYRPTYRKKNKKNK